MKAFEGIFLKKRSIVFISFCFILLFIVGLGGPTLRDHIQDPNLITYFNHDEGYLMNVIWNYFSGEKRDLSQSMFDYGLEMVYLAGISRLFLSSVMEVTPGTFVFMLRCLHLLSWILCFWALFCLIRNHFNDFWQPVLAMTLLAVRPAFAYFTMNLKPDPLMLFFMILGLNYTLKIVENPLLKHVVLATLFAAIAFVIKLSGLFLLPPIVMALYFSKYPLPRWMEKSAWLTPMSMGTVCMILPILIIFFYERMSTGHTFYDTYGFFGSLSHVKFFLYLYAAGFLLILLSMGLFFLKQNQQPFFRNMLMGVYSLSACVFLTGSLFMGGVLLVGFWWILNPNHFITMLVFYGTSFLGKQVNALTAPPHVDLFIQNFFLKLNALDGIIFFLFLLYLAVEIFSYFRNKKQDVLFYKRLVLVVFFLPCLGLLFSQGRMVGLHMLPFFIGMTLLAMQGVQMIMKECQSKKVVASMGYSVFLILFLADVGMQGASVIKARIKEFHKDQDVVFEISKWIKNNIPQNAIIVSDHGSRVYLPVGYQHVTFLNYAEPSQEKLRNLVEWVQPEYVYYHRTVEDEIMLPPLEEIMPYQKVLKVASFNGEGYGYHRFSPKDQFVIYKILY